MMNENNLVNTYASVLDEYSALERPLSLKNFGSGLINNTWKVVAPNNEYIFQRVNNIVFKQPTDIAGNISLITRFLKHNHPEYNFVSPIVSDSGKEMIYQENKGFFRIFPFVSNSLSIDVVETPEQAYEAASQFGKFTKMLSEINIAELKITIPSFHDLSLRYNQFLFAVQNADAQRRVQAEIEIKTLISNSDIVREYARITQSPQFRQRVTHHDTKISNILFDKSGKGLCVIDLDTVMPGYFISDVGDMMRTYLSPAAEEEKDFSLINIRDDFYKAIVRGYCEEMKNELTQTERKYFFYAGKFMIYMQAIRFLTDHLQNDTYYGAKYPDHNLVRAGNQIVLLQKLIEKESLLSSFYG